MPCGCLNVRVQINPAVDAWAFQYLALGRATEHLADDLLAGLLQKLSIKPDGLSVAIDVLYMHIHGKDHPFGPRVTGGGGAQLTRRVFRFMKSIRMDFSF